MSATVISSEVITAASPQNLTIPSGTDVVLVFWGYFSTVTPSYLSAATIDSTAYDDFVEVRGSGTLTAGGCFAWYGIGTGTKALAWSKTTASSARGPILTIVYVSAGGAWRDSDAGNSTAGTAISKVIDSIADDLVIKCDTQINAVPGLSSGWTSISDTTSGTFYQRTSKCDTPGDPSTTCNAENENYSVLVAVSIPELQYPSESEIGLESEVDGYSETGQTPQGVGMQSAIDAESDYVYNNFKLGFNASADTSENTQSIVSAAGLGLNSSMDAVNISQYIEQLLGFRSISDAAYQTKNTGNGIGLSAASDGYREIPKDADCGIGLLSSSDAYNYTAWAAANLSRSIKRFSLTITGAANGANDIEIPFSSFQARKRSDSQSYVSVVIRKYDYAAQIVARQNGEMVIEAVYYVGGIESLRQEIIRAPIDTIRTYEGPSSRSITIDGYKTVTYHGKAITLQNHNYRSLASGNFEFRFADIDLFLNPQDELTVGSDTFTVGEVAYYASENQRQMYVKQSS